LFAPVKVDKSFAISVLTRHCVKVQGLNPDQLVI